MHSSDNTIRICQEYTDKIHFFQKVGFVEPARNFAISKAINEWVLVLDADERILEGLKSKIIGLINQNKYDYIELPRKTFMFGRWIMHSGCNNECYPRLFRKGKVIWKDEIHSSPTLTGVGFILNPEKCDEYIDHYSYSDISQFVEKLNRYTSKEVLTFLKKDEKFSLENMYKKSFNDFLVRFFDKKGYADNYHGIVYCELMNFYWIIAYLKLWENSKYNISLITDDRIKNTVNQCLINNFENFLYFWHKNENISLFRKIILGLIRKIIKVSLKLIKFIIS
jgi:glycosyltransferase involved in cell wall biosynthesis